MKKITMNMAAVVLPLLFIAFLSSCKKEGLEVSEQSSSRNVNEVSKKAVEKPFKAKFETWYRVVSTQPEDLFPGSTIEYNGYFPGGGEGNATHMGYVKTCSVKELSGIKHQGLY
jgi:hypothetical protein